MDESEDRMRIEKVLDSGENPVGDENPWDIGLPEPKTATEQLIQDRGSVDRMAIYFHLANERQIKSTQSEEATDALFE
jgi:hypothetical protein